MIEFDDQPLGYLLARVGAALRTQVVTTVLDPLDLAFQQYICLRMLSHESGLSNAELARGASVSRQAMNIVLQRLEDRGLVTRPDSVSSGRALPTELTQAGLDLLAQTDTGVAAAERTVLANLSESDRRELKRLLAAAG
jgi:DNA-binding MarR family transcriptional regulator